MPCIRKTFLVSRAFLYKDEIDAQNVREAISSSRISRKEASTPIGSCRAEKGRKGEKGMRGDRRLSDFKGTCIRYAVRLTYSQLDLACTYERRTKRRTQQETHIQTDRQTQTRTQTHTDRHTYTHRQTHTDKHTQTNTHRQTHTPRQTHTQTCRTGLEDGWKMIER